MARIYTKSYLNTIKVFERSKEVIEEMLKDAIRDDDYDSIVALGYQLRDVEKTLNEFYENGGVINDNWP